VLDTVSEIIAEIEDTFRQENFSGLSFSGEMVGLNASRSMVVTAPSRGRWS
jgi:hypothetical protein